MRKGGGGGGGAEREREGEREREREGLVGGGGGGGLNFTMHVSLLHGHWLNGVISLSSMIWNKDLYPRLVIIRKLYITM